VCFAPGDGSRLASGGADGRVKVWEVASRVVQAELEHGGGWVRGVCFAPGDGSRLASGGQDGRVKVWEVAMVAVQVELEHGGGRVFNVCISPDGAMLAAEEAKPWSGASAGTGKWKVWDIMTGAPVLPAPDTAKWQLHSCGGFGDSRERAATAAFEVSVDDAAAVTVRSTGAADADADLLRFSPAETVQSKSVLILDGTIAVVRGTLAPPLILVPRGLDLLGGSRVRCLTISNGSFQDVRISFGRLKHR
jgi:WD40 repeat protein